jgi:hypothetical protein
MAFLFWHLKKNKNVYDALFYVIKKIEMKDKPYEINILIANLSQLLSTTNYLTTYLLNYYLTTYLS